MALAVVCQVEERQPCNGSHKEQSGGVGPDLQRVRHVGGSDILEFFVFRLVQAKEIRCELCEVNLISVSDLRVHLFKDGHKTKLAKYLRDTK
jgi:hypothetical protein